MKKQHYYIILAICSALLIGCNAKENAHDHDHKHEEGHQHGETEEVAHEHGEDAITLHTEQAEKIGIATEDVTLAKFHSVIKTSGKIEAAQGAEKTIVATSNGIISFRQSAITEGTAVKNGESLLSISASSIVDGDPVLKANANYEIAKQEYERANKLIEDKLISQKEYNEIKLNYEQARLSSGNFAKQNNTRGASISSPIAGFIKAKLVEDGQYVSVGDPLLVVSQTNKLQLQADVPERHYNDLAFIRTANFKTPYKETVYQLTEMDGKLLSYARSGNGEYYIPISFQFNNQGDIISGGYVEVYLVSKERDNVMTIPLSALTEEQGIYFVYTKICVEDYEKNEVKLGTNDGVRVEVLSGLNVGDKVVTHGAYHVKLASASEAIPHGHSH